MSTVAIKVAATSTVNNAVKAATKYIAVSAREKAADELEDRINSIPYDEQLELLKLLIEKGLIVRPDNLPLEYAGQTVLECIMTVKAKPEKLMKPAEKAFIRYYIKVCKNYIKQQMKEDKKHK